MSVSVFMDSKLYFEKEYKMFEYKTTTLRKNICPFKN